MKTVRYTFSVVFLVSIALCNSAFAQTAFVRVDGDQGSPSPPLLGDAWGGNAYEFLQDAIDQALFLLTPAGGQFDDVEIWVAATDPANPYLPSGLGFQMNNSVGIYGGFLGTDNPQGPEIDRDQRNLLANVTVLSGDLGGDDDAGGINGVNSPHVVFTSFNLDQTAVLDGFTVTAGNADGDADFRSGGGIFSKGAQMIVNCTITGNSAIAGGGVWCEPESSGHFVNCIIADNQATTENGGGVGRGLLI